MTHILVINAGMAFGHSNGELNKLLTQVAVETLTQLGHEVQETHIAQGYDTASEVKKILWADAVIYQFPGWWMGGPWILKKYMDDVFSAGAGSLYQNDGRTRSDPSKKYGSGGLIQGKKYMFCSTWNAPLEAFEDSGQFFEGKGIEAVLFPMHKANQFLGMQGMPSFMCNDVMKDGHLDADVARYKAHLASYFPLS